MNKLLFSIKQMWEQIKPQPAQYVITKDINDYWFVVLLKGSIKQQIGPRFKGRGDVLRFYEDIIAKEAYYERRIYRRRSIY